MRFFQRVLFLLRPNKIIFAFFSAGTLPAADKIKFMRFFQRVLYLLVLKQILFAFLSVGTLPAADEKKIVCVSFIGALPAADKINDEGYI